MKQIIHTDLEDRWQNLSFMEQMANLGSEVIRATKWKEKGRDTLTQAAFLRAEELFRLTINAQISHPTRLQELTRARECFFDFLIFDNTYHSSIKSWESYFRPFTMVARSKLQ